MMATLPAFPNDAPPAAVMRALSRFDRQQLGFAIEVMIALLDMTDGDADAEPAGDERDAAWIEWHNMRGSQKRGPNIADEHEDAEVNGDEQDGNDAEDEECAWFAAATAPGCPISDPGGCEHDGREPTG